MSESGFSEFDVRGWMGLLAPAGLPDEVDQRLNTELSNIVADGAIVQKFAALGTQARPAPRLNLSFASLGWLNTDLKALLFSTQIIGPSDASSFRMSRVAFTDRII